jgi:hypothetical protein
LNVDHVDFTHFIASTTVVLATTVVYAIILNVVGCVGQPLQAICILSNGSFVDVKSSEFSVAVVGIRVVVEQEPNLVKEKPTVILHRFVLVIFSLNAAHFGEKNEEEHDGYCRVAAKKVQNKDGIGVNRGEYRISNSKREKCNEMK